MVVRKGYLVVFDFFLEASLLPLGLAVPFLLGRQNKNNNNKIQHHRRASSQEVIIDRTHANDAPESEHDQEAGQGLLEVQVEEQRHA